MLSHREPNKLDVRRSGASIFPSYLTRVVTARRLSGCSCYRRRVIDEFSFDTKLIRWGFSEDLDFSHRVHKKYPGSLYAIPNASVMHFSSTKARLPINLEVSMKTVYTFYVFFKDVFEKSAVNLVAFLWSQLGNVLMEAGKSVLETTSRQRQYLIYLIFSYLLALRYLARILRGDLEFINRAVIALGKEEDAE